MKLADRDNDAGWFGRLAHYDFLILAAGEGVYVAASLLKLAWPGAWPLVIASTVLVLVGMLASNRHERIPCEKCVADMPLDAQAQAAKRSLSLRIHHASRSPAWLAILLGTAALTWVMPYTVGALVFMVLGACVGVSFVAGWRHRPLQPVCPWCNWRDWDDDQTPERTPAPDPAGAKTA